MPKNTISPPIIKLNKCTIKKQPIPIITQTNNNWKTNLI